MRRLLEEYVENIQHTKRNLVRQRDGIYKQVVGEPNEEGWDQAHQDYSISPTSKRPR